jgi:hypothetical protein
MFLNSEFLNSRIVNSKILNSKLLNAEIPGAQAAPRQETRERAAGWRDRVYEVDVTDRLHYRGVLTRSFSKNPAAARVWPSGSMGRSPRPACD